MKNKFLTAALLIIGFAAAAQTEKKEKLTSNSQLVYATAPDGRKNGLYYIKNTNNDAVIVQGRYTNNVRSGTWYFFSNSQKPLMRYNYDQKKLLQVDSSALHNVAVHVLTDDTNAAKKASAPLPLCPVDYYSMLVGNELFNNHRDEANDNLTAEITAHIAPDGKAYYTVAYLLKKKKTEEQIFNLTSPFPVEWIPSMYEGKPLSSEFTIYAKIHPDALPDDYRRFRWDN